MRPRVLATSVAAISVVAAIAAGCGGPAPADDGTLDELRTGFTARGLEVCGQEDAEVDLPGAVGTTTFELAFDCDADDEALVAATEFDDVEDRDGAAAQYALESTRGIGRGLNRVWTFGPFTVVLSGPRDDAVADAVTETLDDVGAR